jgi:LPS export ABC transporter protein LptC
MKVNWNLLKVLSLVFLITSALSGGYLLLRRTEMSMPSLFPAVSPSRLIMSMEGFRFTQSENGRVAWRMHARKADLYESKEAELQDVAITFIAPDNKQAELIGEVGTMDTASGNASIRRISQEVRIVTSDGYLLTTPALYWKASERTVSTPDRFKLLGSEIYLEGKGLSGNADMQKIVVNGNVKAVLQE